MWLSLREGRAGRLLEMGAVLTAQGWPARCWRSGPGRARAWGAALIASSTLTRFGIFEAGQPSARDPKYVVAPPAGAPRR